MAKLLYTPPTASTAIKGFNGSDVYVVLSLLVTLLVLAVVRNVHYLLFHTMAELLSIVVSFSIFALAWISSRYLSNGYLVVLGGAYGAIGLVDVFHTLTFQGMNLFAAVSTNYPTQFWLTARFLEALALLCAPFAIHKKPAFEAVSGIFLVIALVASGAVMMHWFPVTFIDGVGLTAFKIYSEYLIIGMLGLALWLLVRAKAHFESRIFFLLVTSLVLAGITEFCFTRYVRFYDFANELGHYFRYLSVALAFMAIVLSGVRQPFDLIFRELEQKNRELDQLNTRLHTSEDQLNQAQAVAKVGSWYLDIKTGHLTWSAETYRMFGVPLGTPQSFESFADFVYPDDAAAVFAAWALALQGGTPYDIEHRIVVAGQLIWVRERAELQFAPDGSAVAGLGTVQDITAAKQAQAELRDSQTRMAAVFQASPIGIVISRLSDGYILEVNDACLRMYNYTREAALGHTVAELSTYVHPQQRVQLLQRLHDAGAVEGFLVDYRRHDGSVGVLEMSARVIELQSQPCLLALLFDVTERQQQQALIHDQAFHDALTQLPNRRLLANRLHQAMLGAKRSGCYSALMFLDLDNFKPINDLHGHEVGDLLLMEAACRLRRCVREIDTVARVGGDEFVLMLSELSADQATSAQQAQGVAEKVQNALSAPYVLLVNKKRLTESTVEHCCTVSIGVVLFVDDQAGYQEILAWADSAMYEAKRGGRNLIRFYAANR